MVLYIVQKREHQRNPDIFTYIYIYELVNYIIFMSMGWSRVCRVIVVIWVALFVFPWKKAGVMGSSSSPQVSAMFVFGDSLVDNGNNNYLSSLARSNFLPYGIDFTGGPTGRFCNGKTIIDFLGDLLGLPLLPAFVDTFTGSVDILRGVNYASAAAGILDETGKNLGDRYSLRQQVENFETTVRQLKSLLDDKGLSQYLAKSLVMVELGSNDYINNYLMPSIYTSRYIYTPEDYADLLVTNLATNVLALYRLGLKKFVLAAIGPLGCMPNQLATRAAPPGDCVSIVNDMVRLFNQQLRSLVDQLNTNYTDAVFVYGNTYDAFLNILNNPYNYGFRVTDRGCCGIGRNKGQITCLPLSIPCFNREEYVFWDAYHPTQAFNQIIAQRAYNGSQADCYPINLNQLAHL